MRKFNPLVNELEFNHFVDIQDKLIGKPGWLVVPLIECHIQEISPCDKVIWKASGLSYGKYLHIMKFYDEYCKLYDRRSIHNFTLPKFIYNN